MNLSENSTDKTRNKLISRVRDLGFSAGEEDFQSLALDVFRFQYQNNKVYKNFTDLLQVHPEDVRELSDIPCLPVESFRDHDICTGVFNPEAIYRSSGTTQVQSRSKHLVRSLEWYHEISNRIYSQLVCPVKASVFYALLPGYIEREDASLVAMAKSFMRISGHEDKFYLDNHRALEAELEKSINRDENVVVIGVTHALLKWLEGVEAGVWAKKGVEKGWSFTIIETGGMKGHGREPIREEVHARIQSVLPFARIISEYGMTELLSQAYSLDGRFFQSPPWMRVVVRDPADPGCILNPGRTGRLQIIDLANIDSCAFISTSDLGRMKVNEDTPMFEVLGRFDHAEVRGCNLLSL
tara:strand:- start:1238 stop:2299 length:1062 start_codon:yes stop_codon:yes gene_type:complete